MANRDNRDWAGVLRGAVARLFFPSNRGLLLDLFVFLLNLTVMVGLSRLFVGTIRQASEGDALAQVFIFGMAVALFVLAPLGATLSRWGYHQRIARTQTAIRADPMDGCLFNPIFYFCLTAVIFAAVNATILQTVYGKREPDGAVFVGSIFVGIALMILHTVLVYRYFTIPKEPPRFAFLRSRAAAWIGDTCLFANMVLFQLIWNLLSMVELPRVSGVFDFVARLLILCFLALLLYFPPRMFFLAEDIGKRRTWLMILLANSPILVQVMLGTESGVHW
ncbi:MAG TPA: hypothetical protein PLL78_13500 [Fimbriimonadaceae bacterium]|nr:hypothetical protein [Fimbriimonadaceae bacterium]HRJ97692.1 hypothetical protein [Fimbriimonadaceae bacterium]